MKIAIFAAFPQEIKPIVKKFRPFKKIRITSFKIYLTEHMSSQLLLILTGMGITNAENTIRHVIEEYNPDVIISIGFGGALYDGAVIGDCIWGSRIILFPGGSKAELDLPDNQEILKPLMRGTGIREGSIVTLNRWMHKKDIKQALQQELLLPICDMETFPLAQVSIQKGISFISVRSITDTAYQEIPFHPEEVTDRTGNYNLSKALWLILKKPKLLPEIIKLCRNTKSASLRLCLAMTCLIGLLNQKKEL